MIEHDIRDMWPGKVEPYFKEKDPNGKDAKQPGSKLDAGKAPVYTGLLAYFPRAVKAVAEVSAKGMEKYTWKGWETVPDGINRYRNALGRHLADREITGEFDSETGLRHDSQVAWNALAILELVLREEK